jgi:dipeptidyl aminopeptidase/acylaminoacyl peptidase
MSKNILESKVIQARYDRAKILMQGIFTNSLVRNATLFPTWIDNTDCFWYKHQKADGKEYRLVNAGESTNERAFDHNALSISLGVVVDQVVNPKDLPLENVCINLDSRTLKADIIDFSAFNKRWTYHAESKSCTETKAPSDDVVLSPDGRYAAFSRNYNLWIRDTVNGEERLLTADGEEFFVYGVTGDGWGTPVDSGLQVKWSPDSMHLFTVQRDTRQVKTLPVVHHVPQNGGLRPIIEEIKVAYPGDDHVPKYRLLVIHVETGKIQDAHYPNIPVCRNGWGFFGKAGLGWWAKDSQHTYFVDQERGDKVIRVVEFDIHTGATRVLLEETSETQINISINSEDYPPFFPIPETNELVWWSERSGWAHLYLYDLNDGALKNTITQGDWQVRDVIHFDIDRREVFVQTAGRVSDRDPYYRDLTRINIDTGKIKTLSSSDHEIITITQKGQALMFGGWFDDVASASGVSPTGNYAVISRSRADEVPVSVLLNRDGDEMLELERADVSSLPDNWQWPEPVKLVAADGKTDIFGLIFRPSDFSSDQTYPVISHVFNTSEVYWASKGSFSNGMSNGWPYLDAAALAELGFIVVQIDGRGSPYRGKAFHDHCYGWVESASNLEDHVVGIKQLAKRYRYMDLNRVGITTHTTGGPGGVQGLLQFPEFYKVGVQAILHDSRLMAASMWGDKYEGVSGASKDHPYPEELVENLRGKLLLMHGMLDCCTPPAAVFRLIEALQKANKDFDMLLLPNVAHSCSSYLIRRSWDYLVEHLQGCDSPKDFRLKTVWDSDLYDDIFADFAHND